PPAVGPNPHAGMPTTVRPSGGTVGGRPEPMMGAHPPAASPSPHSMPAPVRPSGGTVGGRPEPMMGAHPPAASPSPHSMPATVRPSGGTVGGRPEPMMGAHTAPTGRVYRNPSGTEAHFGPGGHVETVHARGMTINHGAGGRIEVHRPDHVVVVTNSRGHGYIQRPFAYRGHEFVN